MPAHRLAHPVDIGQYDVVGMDSERESEFVRHVALAFQDIAGHRPTDSLIVSHMGPPLGLGEDGGLVQTHGVLPLTAGERNSIHIFVEDLEMERKAEVDRLKLRIKNEFLAEKYIGTLQYCIRPHQDELTRNFCNGVVQLRRFSCAGFVLAAYEEAGICLLDTDEANLPEVLLESLCAAYPDQETRLRNPAQRANMNLAGDGPWRVVLAGYVINALASTDLALANPRAKLPYRPQSGDAYYPPRRTKSSDAEALP